MIEIKQRLYLLKNNKQDIYVDLTSQLPQHQLDGIRFLYRQYKKKNPGVILNDPPGYGKCVQTVLFLDAMRLVLSKPILIICEEYEVDNWRQQLQRWTNFDDIAVETSNPFAKHMVYINTVKDAYTFCRRTWSVVVVHDNTFAKEKLQAVFKADFKIWVTSVDMKENLRAFSLLYEWLHPNTKVNIQDFAAKKNNPKDVIAKSILLDAYLEDVVIRRNDFIAPFTSKNRTDRQRMQANTVSPPKVTKKNKDPTGTKVKRSRKRIIDDDSEIIVEIQTTNKEIVTNPNEVSESTENIFDFIAHNDKNKNNDRNNEMDIETFIRDEEPIEAEGYETTSQQSSVSTANAKSDTSELQNAINEFVDNENKPGASEFKVTGIDDETVKMQITMTEESNDTQNYFSINANNCEDIIMKDYISEQQENDNEDDVMQRTDFIVPNKSDNLKNELDNINERDIDKKGDKIKTCEVNKNDIMDNSNEKQDVGSSKNNPNAKKNIDDILAELEEKTLKKFKGSFLDRLF